MLHVWWHARVLRWQRVFLDLLSFVFFILVIILVAPAALILEVGGAFVLMRLSIL